MSVCPQCGSPTSPNDKFCNGCGFTLTAPPAFGGGTPAFGSPSQQQQPPQGFGAPPPPYQPGAPPPPFQQGPPPPMGNSPYGPPPPMQGSPFGGPPPPMGSPPAGQRCQQGHEIPLGQSYCAMGHPIALDQMFASDAYGAPGGGPFQPAPQPPPFGAPPPNPMGGPPPPGMPVQQVSYAGGSQPAFPATPQPPNAYGDPSGFGQSPQNQGFGAPPPPAPSPFGGPAGGPPPQFGGGFPPVAPPGTGAPPPFGGGFAPPPPPPPAAPPQAPQAQPAQQGLAPAIDPNPPNRVLRGFLLSYQNNPQGDFWPLLGGRLTVGRANAGEGIEVQLADATISSRHAAFLVDNVSGGVHIEDTGSTNGTYVNEEHIGFNGRRELKDGDRVRFGGYTTIIKVIGRV